MAHGWGVRISKEASRIHRNRRPSLCNLKCGLGGHSLSIFLCSLWPVEQLSWEPPDRGHPFSLP